MNSVEQLIDDVSSSRFLYLEKVSSLTEHEASWKPDAEVWNVIEITEHLFWAEQGGIYGMWKTLHAIRNGSVPRNFESIHKNMPIEQVIDLTWQPKEKVPAVAAPRLGGTLSFWNASLRSLQQVLEEFGRDLKEDELRLQAHPHPISGPLDFQQRVEFLRFHLDRHRNQVTQLITAMRV